MAFRAILLALGFVALIACGCFAAPLPEGCQVTRIVDGDTLHLMCDGVEHKVRLLGYDSPEVFHPNCAAEKAAGERATVLLAKSVAEGPVTGVRIEGMDRYGRDLATVSIAGQDVTGFMLASPLALPYAGHRHPDWCARLGG